jgi:hypothetical protein
MFGYYDGAVVPDSGERIAVEHMFGWSLVIGVW